MLLEFDQHMALDSFQDPRCSQKLEEKHTQHLWEAGHCFTIENRAEQWSIQVFNTQWCGIVQWWVSQNDKYKVDWECMSVFYSAECTGVHVMYPLYSEWNAVTVEI